MKLGIYILIFLAILAWRMFSKTTHSSSVTTSTMMSESAPFNVKEVGSKAVEGGVLKTYEANHTKDGKVARFKLDIVLKQPKEVTGSTMKIAFTKGSIHRQPQSDSSVFIKDLAQALDAETIPSDVKKEDKIDYSAVIFGTNLALSDKPMLAKYFTDEQKGNWIATKLFLGEEQVEVFMYINPVEKIGLFSIKDSVYGDEVLKELMKVI